MRKIISHIISSIFMVIGLYFSYDVPGVSKIFAIGGVIVGALIIGWITQKILESLENL